MSTRDPGTLLIITNDYRMGEGYRDAMDPRIGFYDYFVIDALKTAASAVFKEVCVLTDPLRLFKGLVELNDVRILPLWRPLVGKHRTGVLNGSLDLIGFDYVGSSSFARAVCLDKYLSRALADAYELKQIPAVLIPRTAPVSETLSSHQLEFPVIVKPNDLGASIGITADNVCHDRDAVRQKIVQLRDKLACDVIVEHFLTGDAVSISLIRDGERFWAGAVQRIKSRSKCSNNSFHVYDPESKFCPKSSKRYELLTESSYEEILRKCLAISMYFEKNDYLRIDFIQSEGQFFFLEFASGANLGCRSSFIHSFTLQGLNYEAVIAILLRKSQTAGKSIHQYLRR